MLGEHERRAPAFEVGAENWDCSLCQYFEWLLLFDLLNGLLVMSVKKADESERIDHDVANLWLATVDHKHPVFCYHEVVRCQTSWVL